MKAYCTFCGCHFPDEFEKTLEPPCNFWGEHGLSNVSKGIKKEIWDWLFSAPIDKLNVMYKMSMPIKFNAVPMAVGAGFDSIVSNWSDLTEKEKQDFQRLWFKERMSGRKPPPIPFHYGV